jgi:hypothetical protein
VVEILPFIHTEILQSAVTVIFPTGAALFASAAAVSKARCEVICREFFSFVSLQIFVLFFFNCQFLIRISVLIMRIFLAAEY